MCQRAVFVNCGAKSDELGRPLPSVSVGDVEQWEVRKPGAGLKAA